MTAVRTLTVCGSARVSIVVWIGLLTLLLIGGKRLIAQDDSDGDPAFEAYDVIPPPGIRDWTPSDDQFELYVNAIDVAGEMVPQIDILDDKQQSHMFWMEKHGDTLYLFILPPGYAPDDSLAVRNTVNGLDYEFPFVVWAGTRRATFWFSYESGNITLDTLQPAPFITIVSLLDIPADVETLQLEGKNKNAKIVRTLEKELRGLAELIQLDEGFYRNVWFKVNKTIVQRWKTNETKTGTFLAFRCEDGQIDSVAQILEMYRGDHAPTD
jgi:hypothetical protein